MMTRRPPIPTAPPLLLLLIVTLLPGLFPQRAARADEALPLAAPGAFVAQQYRDFLGRDAEPEGFQYWVAALQNDWVTRSQVVDSFFRSPEFQNGIAPLARLYFAYFNRLPDYPGLLYWIEQSRGGASLDAMSQAFANSPEFGQTYGALSDAQFVELVYANVLGRPAEPAGRAYWIGQLNAGLSRGQLMIGFSESAEYRQRSFSWIQVTMMYVGLLRRAPEREGFDYWVPRLERGESVLGLIGGFLDSDEYGRRFCAGLGPLCNSPPRVQLVAANAPFSDRIQLEWLTTFADPAAAGPVRYVLHAGTASGFVPDDGTANTEIVGATHGLLTGLFPDTRYYVKVEVITERGARAWSNELAAVTAAVDPMPTTEPRRVLDAVTAPNATVEPDRISYDLPTGQAPPSVGELLLSAAGDGYLRRVTGTRRNGNRLTVETVPGSLAEVFEDLQLSAELKLIDVPAANTLAGAASGLGAMSVRASAAQGDTETRRLDWRASGLTLIQERPLDTAPLTMPSSALAPAATATDGRKTKTDFPLIVEYPGMVGVEPGKTLTFEVTAAVQSGYEAAWEITQFFLIGIAHPRVAPDRPNHGAIWSLAPGESDTTGRGTLIWTPADRHIDQEMRPYTATFEVLTRKRDCSWLRDLICTRIAKVEVEILVAWGDLPAATADRFVEGDASLTLSGTAGLDFQPTLRFDAVKRAGGLESFELLLDGPVTFKTEVRLEARAGGAFGARRNNLLYKRFAKVYWIGQVPVVMTGQLGLDLQLRGEASAALDLLQTFDIGYDLETGLRYRDGDWEVIAEATPWQRYDLSGEAEGRAYVELRFIPDLEVRFYEAATGRLILEPYLHASAAVEGHFLYRPEQASGADADYRFTELEVGGGIDGKVRAGLEMFDVAIAGFPSRNPEEYHEFALLDRTPLLSLPRLVPRLTGARAPEDCALGLTMDADHASALLNRWTFVDDSAAWRVFLPNGTEILREGAGPRDAWFAAGRGGRYTLRVGGHSELGSYIRQYADLEVDYVPAEDCGPSEPTRFTKLDASGSALPNEAATWNCVRDNVTGLVWEEKTDDGGLRDKDWTYSWYDPDPMTNGGYAGSSNGGYCFSLDRCDTHRYVVDVNAQPLCGASDWRLPHVDELRSIFGAGLHPIYTFWSSSSESSSLYPGEYAWYVNFLTGDVHYGGKGDQLSVRLVRGGQ